MPLSSDITAQLARKIYALPLLIGLGIALYFAWPVEPHLRPFISVTVIAFILGKVIWTRRDRLIAGGAMALVLVAIGCTTLGFVAAGTRAYVIATPMINAPFGPIGFSGHVQSLEQLEGGKGLRVILDDLHMHGALPEAQVPHSLRLSIRKYDHPIKTGDRIHVFAKIEPASPPTTPGGFDFRRHAFFNQIGGYGYVLGAPRVYKDRVLPLKGAARDGAPEIILPLKGGGAPAKPQRGEAWGGGGDTAVPHKITPSGALAGTTSPFQGEDFISAPARGGPLQGEESRRTFFSYLEIFSLSTWPENLRNAISEHVNTTLPARQAGMVTALLTGERASITEEDWNALRDSGLAHLLAISGSNVDMVALIVFFIARFVMAAFPGFAERHPIKKYAAVLAFAVTSFYVMLILPSPPTTRALLTVAIVLIAILFDRSPISLRLVCVSAAMILLIWPEQLLSPSFQLSFAAVTALVAAFEVLAPWIKSIYQDSTVVRRLVIYIFTIGGTTVIATLATAPISLYHFQNLALYGVIANLLAVPLMTFLIMPLSILCYVLLPFGAADSTLHAVGVLNEWILVIAHRTASLPGARFAPPALPFSAFVAFIIAGLILCLGVGRLRAVSALPLVIGGVLVLTHVRPDMVVLAGGKVVMERRANSTVVTTSRQFARRQQGDWVRYWGGDKDKGAVVDRDHPPSVPVDVLARAGVIVPTTDRPVAIYLSNPPRVKIMTTYGTGRYWE